MNRITTANILAFAVLLTAETAVAGLQPARTGESFRDEVGRRLCYAGRFQFDRNDGSKDVRLGRFIEPAPSSEGHPNAAPLGEVRVFLFDREEFKPEAGKTYCLILTAGSKRGLTVVAFGPDDPATGKELREVIESPRAFENDATWRKRRTLWAKFRKDVAPNEAPLLYGEDDSFRNLLYVKRTESSYPLNLYNADAGKSEPVINAKALPGVNRITYDKGYFRVWFNGSVEMNVGTGGED